MRRYAADYGGFIRSLCRAYVYRRQCQPFGIYAGDKTVGYVMAICNYGIPEYDIRNMMTDKARQDKGCGSAAPNRFFAYIKAKPSGPSNMIALNCNKLDQLAGKLYESRGFTAAGAGDGDEDEIVLALTLNEA